ncbi:MAG: response regulator transcription factor [Saprospiraceae bacterium]
MEPAKAKLLLVEDDPTLGLLLQDFLQSRNYEVHWAKDGVDALRHFKNNGYDLCVLDVMMPGLDGFTVAELVRERFPQLPVIFLTAKSLHQDVVRGFKAGADDYIKKPVDEEELLVRIEAVLKRAAGSSVAAESGERNVYQIGEYRFYRRERRLEHPSGNRNLTEREAELLAMFCSAPGTVIPRELALQKLWNRTDYLARKSMDVFLGRLRKYLAEDPSVRITNIHGSGFILEIGERH